MSIFKKIKKRSWMIQALLQTSLAEKTSMIRGVLNRKVYYPKQKVNADIKNLMYCALCPNMCRFECPVVETTKLETHSPATKARIAYYLEMDRLEKNAENIMPLFEGCLHCSACKPWCPFDLAVGDLLEGVAIDLHKEVGKPEAITAFNNRLNQNNGLYPKDKLKSKSILESLTDGDIYYFPGCVSLGNNTKVIDGIVKIAQIAKVDLKSSTSEKLCCGAPLYYLGDRDKAKEIAAHNFEHIKNSNVNAIICECPECVYTLKVAYEEMGFNFRIPIYHISEWVTLLLKENKIKLKQGDKLKKYTKMFPISFHDPCVLTRKLGVIDEPSLLLEQMFPINFKEATYSKEGTHCCGFGGLVNVVNHEIANNVASKRLHEFKEDGVKTIVTSCPTCWYSFMKNNPEFEFEIYDLVELLVEMVEEVK